MINCIKVHSFWMQVFSTREVHKALRVLPAHADEARSSLALPAWRPRWRTGGRLHLTRALFRVQRQLDGQRITCQLLPNQDGSFALSVRGQGLVSCSTVPDCQRLFETAFPQVSRSTLACTGRRNPKLCTECISFY